MKPSTWLSGMRRFQLLVVSNVALLGFLTLFVWLLLDGATAAAHRASVDVLKLKAETAKQIFEREEGIGAVRVLSAANTNDGWLSVDRVKRKPRVFHAGAGLSFLPRHCFLQYGADSSARLEACLASPGPATDYRIYLEGAFCADRQRKSPQSLVASFEQARLELVTPNGSPLRWWIKPKLAPNDEPKATAFLSKDWSKPPSGPWDPGIQGVIWPSENRKLCKGLKRPAIPIRLSIDGHCLFLQELYRGNPEFVSCKAHREKSDKDRGLKRRDFLRYAEWLRGVHVRFQVSGPDSSDAGGTSEWTGTEWRPRPSSARVSLQSQIGFLLGPGESLAIGNAPDALGCPRTTIGRPAESSLSDEPAELSSPTWQEQIARHLVRIHQNLSSITLTDQPECRSFRDPAARAEEQLAFRLVRDGKSLERDVVARLANQVPRAVAAVTFTLVLFFVVNAAILIPLARLVRHARNEAQRSANARTKPFPFQNRRDEIGTLASELQALVTRVARQATEAETYNTMLSHEITSPLHKLKGTLPDDPHVQKMLSAVNAIDGLTRMVKSQLPDSSIEDLATYLPTYIATKQAEMGPIVFEATKRNHFRFLQRGTLLESVLDNVLANAVRYRPEGTPITVRIFGEHAVLHIDIHNQGPEIPAAEQAAIFAFGYSTSTRRDNKGVGLYVSRYYMQMLDGKLECVPTDNGATFRLSLPALED